MNILDVQNNNNIKITVKYLDNLFTDLSMNLHDQVTLNSIRDTLNMIDKEDICKGIIIGDSNRKLYGMSVYPITKSLEHLAGDVINATIQPKELTKKLLAMKMEYIVEIDPNMLNSKVYNFKPEELTAVLLHELGHVTADSDFYNDMKLAYTQAIFKSNKANEISQSKLSNKDVQIGVLYMLSAIQETQITKYCDVKETMADRFVVDMGYGEPLRSAIEKFNKVYMSLYNKKSREDLINQEAVIYANLSKMFNTRKAYVENLLDMEAKQNPSDYVRTILDNIKRKLKSALFLESTSPLAKDFILSEGFFDIWNSNPIKVSEADIDELKIDLQMMQDYDDKYLLVYKIHKRISQLDDAVNKVGNDSRMLSIIKHYKDELNKILKSALDYKVVEKSYGVFIKYPKGYEG